MQARQPPAERGDYTSCVETVQVGNLPATWGIPQKMAGILFAERIELTL